MFQLQFMQTNLFVVKNLNLSQSLKPYPTFVYFVINAPVFTYLTIIQTRSSIGLLNNIISVTYLI